MFAPSINAGAKMPINLKKQQKQAGWRVNEWCEQVGVGRTKAYELMEAGAVKYVHLGRRRLILISPSDFLSSLVKAA